MEAYRQDRAWSDRYLPAIKATIAPYILGEATEEQDQKEASDLVVLVAKQLRIACRVRRPGYAEAYANEFTVRLARDTGTETEFAKLIKGWGDWMFYAHADHGESPTLARWVIINLWSWREAIWLHEDCCGSADQQPRRTRSQPPGHPRFGDKPNNDISGRYGTYFRWFDLSSFLPAYPRIIVASSHPLP